MIFHINSIESFSAHPDGHSCLVVRVLICRVCNKTPKNIKGETATPVFGAPL